MISDFIKPKKVMNFLQRLINDFKFNFYNDSNDSESHDNFYHSKQLILDELESLIEIAKTESIPDNFKLVWEKYKKHIDFEAALSIIIKHLEILTRRQLSTSLIKETIDSLLKGYKEDTSFSVTSERTKLYEKYNVSNALELIHSTLETKIPIQGTNEEFIDEIDLHSNNGSNKIRI